MTASGFRVQVTGLVFCFEVSISGAEPIKRVPTCVRKPKTNIYEGHLKRTSMLTGFKVSSLVSRCLFYRPEHKANGGPLK